MDGNETQVIFDEILRRLERLEGALEISDDAFLVDPEEPVRLVSFLRNPCALDLQSWPYEIHIGGGARDHINLYMAGGLQYTRYVYDATARGRSFNCDYQIDLDRNTNHVQWWQPSAGYPSRCADELGVMFACRHGGNGDYFTLGWIWEPQPGFSDSKVESYPLNNGKQVYMITNFYPRKSRNIYIKFRNPIEGACSDYYGRHNYFCSVIFGRNHDLTSEYWFEQVNGQRSIRWS